MPQKELKCIANVAKWEIVLVVLILQPKKIFVFVMEFTTLSKFTRNFPMEKSELALAEKLTQYTLRRMKLAARYPC